MPLMTSQRPITAAPITAAVPASACHPGFEAVDSLLRAVGREDVAEQRQLENDLLHQTEVEGSAARWRAVPAPSLWM
jgi:hypothetical protein